MKRFHYGLGVMAGLLAASFGASCGEDGPSLDGLGDTLARECGLACPGKTDSAGVEIKGVLDGNVAISGVAQVDAFFGSVNKFRGTADQVSAGIEAQLELIRADFGIAANADLEAELASRFEANLDGEVNVDYQPARCAVDATATVEANARCEVQAMPPTVMVECKGSCELEAGAELECEAGAELECEFTGPTVACEGTCEGTCEVELEAAAECSGTCRGECDGTCSAYTDKEGTQCAGSCDGICEGSCETKLAAAAECMGTCRGSCKVSGPNADCEGSAHASCKAEANASIMCEGKCEGEFEPPSASAECEASARAEAKLNVQCTPPRLAVNYALKAAAGAEIMARARFEAALRLLVDVRMPALLQASARAKSVASAGQDLRVAAGAAVKASIDAASQKDASLRVLFGLGCALQELPKVGDALEDSADRLNEALMASGDIAGAVGFEI